jgi:hypothetical protein
VPDSVVYELQRLKGLYAGFGARELARIIFHTTMHRMTGQTAQRLWDRLPPAALPFWGRFLKNDGRTSSQR